MKLLDGALAKFEEVLAVSPDMVPALRAAGQAYADMAGMLPPDSAESVAAYQVAARSSGPPAHALMTRPRCLFCFCRKSLTRSMMPTVWRHSIAVQKSVPGIKCGLDPCRKKQL